MRLIQKRRYFEELTLSEVFTDKGEFVCRLVERPYLNNQPNVSCVPEGVYIFSPHKSPSQGDCFILEAHSLGVYTQTHPKAVRTHILWHVGNTAKDVIGCAAVGQEFTSIGGAWGVNNSRVTLDRLKKLITKQTFLIIEKH
ncbi:hypothetical protein NVP1166O_31 [Vibrio phage 1.166.O._10N.261.51.C7]|nr:hypothetical protein NVP1166O_31 [Vibrio phage 1.166.O._10N.261.51.C7]